MRIPGARAHVRLSAGGAITMTARDQDEYSALRATIRERGTARIVIFAGGIVAWAAATIATAALASTPLATLLPLLVLASVFEAVFALHIGVERIGRYLQVFHEDDPLPHRVGAYRDGVRQPAGAVSTDALFIVPFLLAAMFNAAPATVWPGTSRGGVRRRRARTVRAAAVRGAAHRGASTSDRSRAVQGDETRPDPRALAGARYRRSRASTSFRSFA